MTAEQKVQCRDLSGTLRRVRLTDRGPYTSPGSMLHLRLVSGANDVPLLRKSVPPDAGRRDPRLYAFLDNEIRVIAHLNRVLGANVPEVPVLAGYNVDVEEPFALLLPYLGNHARQAVREIDEAEQRRFRIGMLRALHLIGSAGVVHGAVSLDSLRWSGTAAQLVDFEWAQRAGEPRWSGNGRHQPPERLRGVGAADPRDDVYSAGMLIREIVLGTPAAENPTEPGADPERLRSQLDGAFGPVEQRPPAAELLARMRVAAPQVRLANPEAALAEGHRLFDAASRRKGAPDGRAARPAAPPPRRGWRRLLFTLAIVASLTVRGACR